MKKNLLGIISVYIFFFLIFIFLYIILARINSKEQKIFFDKLNKCERYYVQYEFEGKIIDIRKGRHFDKRYHIYAKVSKKPFEINKNCEYYLKNVEKDIIKIDFDNELLRSDMHVPIKVGAQVFKKKSSSAVFLKYNNKAYLLSDFYCPDFDIDWYYSDKKYSYKCDSTLHKVTTEWYWYVVRDSISN